ncbi:hypothetical protein D5S18_23990 [Nocardia panacis]|uniref:WXG100 family type VII secretion target n=2 Tax=Nocardia panacis TaxID=2340916 RepID=A0A3A4JYF8_9NOCA|nr:hypothetical protein D5S18_23990 [Nocardia panacis]
MRYPNLGFDPVPGTLADVATMRDQISSAATAVTETDALLTRLRGNTDSVWAGTAGDAFRANFDATLAQDLGYAQKSLERAVRALSEWHGDLVGFQDSARGLEAEAAAARADRTKAAAAQQNARANPDLALANQTFADPAQLQSAQTRLDAANAALRAADASVTESQGKLDFILQRARDLQAEHDRVAGRKAAELESAAKEFAPSPPDKSIWDNLVDAVKGVGEWISQHRKQIHDVLANVSAIAGLIALLTPPPIDAIAGAVALVTGVGALATDFMDPEVRDAFKEVVTGFSDLKNNGDFSTEASALGKLGSTVGVDVLGAIPGVTGATKGVKALTEAADFGTAVREFASGVQSPTSLAKKLDPIFNIKNVETSPTLVATMVQEFGEANRWSPGAGTTLNGVELFLRSVKGGVGSGRLVSMMGSSDE